MGDIEKRAHDLALLYLSKHTYETRHNICETDAEHQKCFVAIYNDVYDRFKDQILKDQWN